jgi:hypothetical protein
VTALLKEIRHSPLIWLLVFVPAPFVAERSGFGKSARLGSKAY